MKVNSNSNNFREMFWDESNRLRVVNDNNNQLQHYIYDAAGERTLKASSQIESVYENGQIDASSTTIGLYTTYVSPYMVVDANQKYSKHYFNGTQRVASKIGEQDIIVFENMPLPIAPETEIENTPFTDFDTLKTKQISDLSYYLSKSTDKTTARNFNIKFKEFKKQDIETQQITENNSAYAAPQYAELYYYHSDHLGTGTFLSDFEGNPYQFFLNLPFGETMAEQHSYSGEYTNRYKFNGKELDEETGFYYYGARYYNPKFSIWLSTDPLAEKFPNASPYNYCLGNPINLVDPDGRAPEPPKNGIPQFIDNTGVYHWDASRNKYEHYSPKNGTFQGYYTVNSSSKAVGKSVSIDNSKPATITEPSFLEKARAFGLDMDAKVRSLEGASGLREVATGMQDWGDGAALTGYGLTVSVVGAEAGVPLAAAGNVVSTIGSLIEIGLDFNENKKGKALFNLAIEGAAEIITHKIDKIPGVENATKEILKQNVNLKSNAIPRVIDAVEKKENK